MVVGFLVRNILSLTDRWTTTHWISAATSAGHTVWVFQETDVSASSDGWLARAFLLDKAHSPQAVAHALTRRTAPRKRIRLARLEVLFLRSQPLDPATLGLAMVLEGAGVRIVNAPAGMLVVAHKSWLATQDLPTPPTLVTTSRGDAHGAHMDWGHVVVKPDRGSGGERVAVVAPGDHEHLDRAFGAARVGRSKVVIQKRLDGSGGERRLIWCDGEILGGYLRIAAKGEFRHNLKRGAIPSRVVLTDEDLLLGPLLAPLLVPLGVRFAGLDVLDGHLVEVNAVNPGGTVYADALHGTRLADAVIRRLLEAPC